MPMKLRGLGAFALAGGAAVPTDMHQLGIFQGLQRTLRDYAVAHPTFPNSSIPMNVPPIFADGVIGPVTFDVARRLVNDHMVRDIRAVSDAVKIKESGALDSVAKLAENASLVCQRMALHTPKIVCVPIADLAAAAPIVRQRLQPVVAPPSTPGAPAPTVPSVDPSRPMSMTTKVAIGVGVGLLLLMAMPRPALSGADDADLEADEDEDLEGG
jgi:hypothetical protein